MSRRLKCPSRRPMYLRTAISTSPIFNAMALFQLPSRPFGRHSGKEQPEKEQPV